MTTPPLAQPPDAGVRKLVVVADDSSECRLALRYATRRAQRTRGRLSLLYVMEPLAGQQWMAVEARMREEARDEAERVLFALACEVEKLGGAMPELVIREGVLSEEVLAFICGEPEIRLLVLGARIHREGPSPLVGGIAGGSVIAYPVPVTIVPGALSPEAIDAL
jgi:nucleotide-binding universal stress UspA family protein